MKRFEGAPQEHDTISLEQTEPELDQHIEDFRGSHEDLKDMLFDVYMKQQLLEDFFETLAGYVDEADVDEIRELMAGYSNTEVYAALSLPHELRERKFAEFEQRIAAGEEATEVMKQFIAVSNKYEFGVGYHTSPIDIRPDETGKWLIKGTEADHRDDDLMMAYYSSQYRHLFKKRHPKFIYIVRTEPQTHKTDGNWSRASSLSVVGRVPFEDVYSYVESTSKEITATPENGMAE